VLAGLVICLVLIPSALAYAELAGFGPIAGIFYAALTEFGLCLKLALYSHFRSAVNGRLNRRL
jgi:hypothetical protein